MKQRTFKTRRSYSEERKPKLSDQSEKTEAQTKRGKQKRVRKSPDRPLNSRQEEFCKRLAEAEVSGDVNYTYIATLCGYSEKSACDQAIILKKNPRVVQRVSEIRSRLIREKAEQTAVTIALVRSEHTRLAAVAEAEGDLSTATRNIELLGRTIGAYRDALDVDITATRTYSDEERARYKTLARSMLMTSLAADSGQVQALPAAPADPSNNSTSDNHSYGMLAGSSPAGDAGGPGAGSDEPLISRRPARWTARLAALSLDNRPLNLDQVAELDRQPQADAPADEQATPGTPKTAPASVRTDCSSLQTDFETSNCGDGATVALGFHKPGSSGATPDTAISLDVGVGSTISDEVGVG